MVKLLTKTVEEVASRHRFYGESHIHIKAILQLIPSIRHKTKEYQLISLFCLIFFQVCI